MNNSTTFEAFFRPKSIALFGASGDAKKITARPQRYLQKAGYGGAIVPINPGRSNVLGIQAYPSLGAYRSPVDHAFVMVGADDVESAIDECCEHGVRVATIFSAGFAELGAGGVVRQQKLVQKARSAGLRLLGPNCLGMVNVTDRIPLTANAVVDQETLRHGYLSVVSQSGSMLGTLLTRAQARGLGFSKLISVGNECDLGVGEITQFLADDPETGAILLFLETFRDSDALAQAARSAFASGKPVIAYKLGRSEVAQKLAGSHTGAMAGSDDLANAFFRDTAIVRVDTLDGLIEAAPFLKGQKPPRGRRVGVLTATGGVAAMVVDKMSMMGADVVAAPAAMRERLAEGGIHLPDAPIVDIPMGGSEGGRYSRVLSELLKSDHCDAVVSVIGSSARTNPQVILDRVLSASGRDKKPLAVFLGPKADAGLELLQSASVAGFSTPESCADVVSAYLHWRAPVVREKNSHFSKVQAASQVSVALTPELLNEKEAAKVFSALGVPMAPNAVVDENFSAVEFDGPYAVKVLSSDIPHKTDAGLVHLGVMRAELKSVTRDILSAARFAFPQAKIDGVLVQPMVRGLAEVIVGFRRDPEVGPLVLLAMGGITAELKKSRSVRLAPVDRKTAMEMVEDIPELAVVRGYRNLPLGDVEALANVIVAVSHAGEVQQGRIAEAEINPLLIMEAHHGVIAVDSLLSFS